MNNLNLNKENLWNEMNEIYPKAMKIFCEWIDAYKKEIGWDWLFGNNIDAVHYKQHQIKFHDIPFAMQIGILILFFSEYKLVFTYGTSNVEDAKSVVRVFLRHMENELI